MLGRRAAKARRRSGWLEAANRVVCARGPSKVVEAASTGVRAVHAHLMRLPKI